MCNMSWHIYSKGNAQVRDCIWLLLILNTMQLQIDGEQGCNLTPNSVQLLSAAAHHTAEQYSLTGRLKLK